MNNAGIWEYCRKVTKSTVAVSTTSKSINETNAFADVITFPAETHLKCTWTPQKAAIKLQIYLNLSHDEKLASRALRFNETIFIKPADKGEAIVVINKANGIKKLPHDKQFYAKKERELVCYCFCALTQ